MEAKKFRQTLFYVAEDNQPSWLFCKLLNMFSLDISRGVWYNPVQFVQSFFPHEEISKNELTETNYVGNRLKAPGFLRSVGRVLQDP